MKSLFIFLMDLCNCKKSILYDIYAKTTQCGRCSGNVHKCACIVTPEVKGGKNGNMRYYKDKKTNTCEYMKGNCSIIA